MTKFTHKKTTILQAIMLDIFYGQLLSATQNKLNQFIQTIIPK